MDNNNIQKFGKNIDSPKYIDEKYSLHKKIFNIKNDKYLDIFEELLGNSKEIHLECSCKIEKDNIHAKRFIINYFCCTEDENQPNLRRNISNLNLIFYFFKKLSGTGVILNYEIIKKVISRSTNFQEFREIIIAMDLRDNINDSNVKFYFALDKKSESVRKIINELNLDKEIFDYIEYGDCISIMFGFEFSFDGKASSKTYAIFKEKNESLSRSAFEGHSPRLISFRENSKNKTFYFYLEDLEIAADKIDNRKYMELSNLLKDNGINIKIISLNEEGNYFDMEKINIYY